VLGLIVLLVAAVGIGVLLWWGTGLPPTRPRPGSRSRGEPYVAVHRRLAQRRRRG